MDGDVMFEIANHMEAALWIILGIGFFAYGLWKKLPLRGSWLIVAITLLAFGGSDVVEARTGAWWRPWWLFVLKAVCVVTLSLCLIQYYRNKSR